MWMRTESEGQKRERKETRNEEKREREENFSFLSSPFQAFPLGQKVKRAAPSVRGERRSKEESAASFHIKLRNVRQSFLLSSSPLSMRLSRHTDFCSVVTVSAATCFHINGRQGEDDDDDDDDGEVQEFCPCPCISTIRSVDPGTTPPW